MATIDELIGSQIRAIRKNRGMSQIELAERIGLSFQQVQKYEKGATRMPVFRLQQIAGALDVPISVFFGEAEGRRPRVAAPGVEYSGALPEEIPSAVHREGLLLLDLFRQVRNRKAREGLLRLVRGIVELENPG